MSNADIAEVFETTGQLLDITGADSFRAGAFFKTAIILVKLPEQVSTMTPAERVVAIGKSMSQKVEQLEKDGFLKELEDLKAQVPQGVLEIREVNGLGPKKVRQLWQEEGIETLEALEELVRTGGLAKIKGFGEGTQSQIIRYFDELEQNRGHIRLDKAMKLAAYYKQELESLGEVMDVRATGQVARAEEIVDKIGLLVVSENLAGLTYKIAEKIGPHAAVEAVNPFYITGKDNVLEVGLDIRLVQPGKAGAEEILMNSETTFLKGSNAAKFSFLNKWAELEPALKEEEVFSQLGQPFTPIELRHSNRWDAEKNKELVTDADIKGILHCHSTYSDGTNTLAEMATAVMQGGYEYFGIADHSQTAAYANGLDINRLRMQWAEVDILNQKMAPFKILKGIESDILINGDLDYDEEVLAQFDYVVASIHSSLRMDQAKATERVIRAVANPYTTILGHPTSRLILKRQGYPIDVEAVLQACAEYNVSVELNASPYRLDIDWRHLERAQELGVKVSINPDSHNVAGLQEMAYGVRVARRGGLLAANTFNTMGLQEMEAHLNARKKK